MKKTLVLLMLAAAGCSRRDAASSGRPVDAGEPDAAARHLVDAAAAQDAP